MFASMRVNVREIDHERAFIEENVGYTQPTFTIETKDHTQVQSIIDTIKNEGFPKVTLVKPSNKIL